MPNIDFSIDMHCHPTYKPLGKSYNTNPGVQSSNNDDQNSMWYYDPPSLFDKILNDVGSLTKFSQTNFTSNAYGQVWVAAAAMGCIEKWFFNNKLGTGILSDILGDFATEIGIKRINAIQGTTDYFKDLLHEFDFLDQMNGKLVEIDGNTYMYQIVRNFDQLNKIIAANGSAINTGKNNPLSLAIIPTIEGMHVLNCGLGRPCNPNEVKQNAFALKNFLFKPWFVTFAHHFYNELCGHSQSLQGIVGQECDQSTGMNTGFTVLGYEVLDILLDNSNNKRILIDIKHLSPLGRSQFFTIRQRKYPEIPIIISHGACNGLPEMNNVLAQRNTLGSTFNNAEINFYDNEILEMARSGGIIGLQLDERRIASVDALKNIKHSIFRNKIMYYRSKLVWNQIQYIAELLDDNDLPAWQNMTIGSDYDGIVDPINSFWTTEQYPALKSYLEKHAYNYVTTNSANLKNDFNKIEPDVIVQNIFQTNALDFLKKWF